MQSNHFTDFLSPELQKAGYSAIYKKKTTEIFTGNAYAIDGCATFFRRDRFSLVKKYEVRLQSSASASAGVCLRDELQSLLHHCQMHGKRERSVSWSVLALSEHAGCRWSSTRLRCRCQMRCPQSSARAP